jgi:hypothetical protein
MGITSSRVYWMLRATRWRSWRSSAEETHEADEGPAEDLPNELADTLEATRALAGAVGMSWARLLALAAEKRTRRGGFEKRIFLEFVEPPTQS